MTIEISNIDLFAIYMLPLFFMVTKWIATKAGKGHLDVFNLFFDMSILFLAESFSTFIIVRIVWLLVVSIFIGFSLTFIALINATDLLDDRGARIADLLFPFLILFLQYLPVISYLFNLKLGLF